MDRIRSSVETFWSRVSIDARYILLIACITCIAFAPFTIGHRVSPSDEHLGGYYQYSMWYDAALRENTSYLWNPYSYGGFPTYLNQFGAFLYPPVQILFSFLKPLQAFYFSITLAVFIGIAYAYLFARQLSLSPVASFLAALTYSVAQQPGTFTLGVSYAFSFAALPFVMYCLVRIKRATTWRELVIQFILLSVGMASAFLAAYFGTLMYALVLIGCFTLFVDFYGARVGMPSNYRATLSLAVSLLVGISAGIVQFVGLLEYLPFTSRTAHFARDVTAGVKLMSIEYLRFLIPYNFEIPFDSGRGYFYFGIVGLLGICSALFNWRRAIVIFFGIAYLGCMWFSMNLPIAEWINLYVPPFARTGNIDRWLLMGAFPAALLAGIGFDSIAVLHRTVPYRRFWVIFRATAISALGLLALIHIPLHLIAGREGLRESLFFFVLKITGRSPESFSYPTTFYTDHIGKLLQNLADTYSFTNPYFVFFLLVSTGLIYECNRRIISDSYPVRNWKLVILLVCGWGIPFAYMAGSTIAASAYFGSEPAVVRAIGEIEPDIGAYRVITLQGGVVGRAVFTGDFPPESRAILVREMLLKESASLYGVRNIAGFEPIRSVRQNQLVDAVFSLDADIVIDKEAIKDGAALDTYFHTALLRPVPRDEKMRDFLGHLPLLSMMNVKYIVSAYPLIDPSLEEVSFEKDARIPFEYHLYRNRNVLEHVYIAHSPELWRGSDRELLLAMLDEEDFSKKTFIECKECVESTGGKAAVEIEEKKDDSLRVRVESSGTNWLVFSESNLPGWIATIDGERVPIRTANYLFQGVEIPDGEHEVEFRYVGSFALFLERLGLREI